MTRDWIRRLASLLTTIFLIIIVEPFAHVNVEQLAREHHWDNVLIRVLAALPDLSSFLDSSFFWFCFGGSVGVAVSLWVVKIGSDKAAPSLRVAPLVLEFSESTEGCRLPVPDEDKIVFRAVIKNPNDQDVGARAYLVGITKQDMAGNFGACGFSDKLLLTFAGEGASGPKSFSVIHKHVPKFLDILWVGATTGVKMATEDFFWPNPSAHVFENAGVFRITVTLVAHTGDAGTFDFILQWPGQWDQSHLSLAQN
jgi:hypothetical protein